MTKLSIAALVSILLTTSTAPAQRPPDNPGAEHVALVKMAGEYTTATRFRPSGEAPWTESTGTAKYAGVLDGRFVAEESSGEMVGQQFKAKKLYGYNNAAKRYEGVWIYTGSTAIMTLNGNSKDGGKTIVMSATFATAGDANMTLAVTLKRISDDSFMTELAMKGPDGASGATMETTYTRKK